MAKISDRVHKMLQRTEANYLTVETLREINSCIVNSTASLPFYVAYKNEFDHLRASIDGQKFELRFRNILARHSPKYFGMQPGISLMTLVAGHLPINSKVISANEHESHHIYDLLFNQMTDMDLDIISTDQHGINAFNFAIMNSYGYQFAPRYAKFKKHFESHFQLKCDSQLSSSIDLKKKINWDLILDEWESIVQILASLEQKNTTQEYLVKRLCAYKKHNKTIKALAEYDRVYRLMYLLDYVDDESLRRHVQGSLCNGEAFHQMQRSIASANGSDKIRGFDEKDLMVWNESAKLIANSVIYYNTAILSRLLEYYKATGYQEGVNRLMTVSPISWTHINFSGRFMFASNDEYFGIEDIVEELKMAA
jgi:TnpA family transposase